MREIELQVQDLILRDLLHFGTNHPTLFAYIEQITGCGRIEGFQGRIYCRRAMPGKQHYYPWHNDYRLVGMSINLSPENYAGGILQIRHRLSKQLLSEVANTGFGDGVIFRIASELQHRVTKVEGTADNAPEGS